MLQCFLRVRAAPWKPDVAGGGLLVIAPHPDDESLGCGAFIATRRRRGQPVHIVWLTDGDSSHTDFDGGPPQLAAKRREEAHAAATALGVPMACRHFLGAPDSQLPHLDPARWNALRAALSDRIDSIKPAIVLVTSDLDGSTEHSAACRLGHEAIEMSSCRPTLRCYLVWAYWNIRQLWRVCRHSKVVHFETADAAAMECRARAIACHKTQKRPRASGAGAPLTDDFLGCLPAHGEFLHSR